MVKKRGRQILLGVFGSMGILLVGFIVFFIGTNIGTTSEVEVGLKEWAVNVEPPVVKSGQHPFETFGGQKLIFQITNTGDITHEFVIVRTEVAPNELPIEGDRVRYYSYEGEDKIEPKMYFHTTGVWPLITGPTLPTPEIEPSADPGIVIAPGETKVMTIGCGKHACWPGTAYVLFSNQPGDYERGMYTGFIITDPPFINTYWWVILLAVVIVGLLIIFLKKKAGGDIARS
jgi:hypothetical protein